jgi:hypothetical protein
MVTRRALLISNAGETGAENYCRGVFADIANYKRFLDSAQGGWWFSTEVVAVDRPTKNEVRALVKNLSSSDYLFIAFAGHGWYSSTDNATVLTLKNGEDLSSLELYEGRAKKTIVLDCCRQIHNESALEEAREMQKMAFSAAAAKRTPDGKRCRALFDQQIERAGDELVICHSSTPPEKSGDDERVGGHYTSSLIAAAVAWADEVAEDHSLNNVAMSVVSAHEQAAPVTTRRRGGKQHPSIEKPKSGPYFPFAVFST